MVKDWDVTITLTEREGEILGLVAEGLSNRAIAQRLDLSLHTVKWYLKEIYSKLQVGSRTQAVAAAINLGLLEEDDDPQKRSDVQSHNLPAAMMPFVGRHDELTTLRNFLTDPNIRLITIHGGSGTGKTRLAIEAARRSANEFRDGVFLVVASGASDMQELIPVVADALQIPISDLDELSAQIIDYLRTREILLVVDSFEHLLVHASVVTEVLQAAPELTVLVTSSEKLGLIGEVLLSIDGIDYPPENTSGGDPMGYSACQLFEQHARSNVPDFQITIETKAQISELVRLVEGMPLAIELAAAWVDVLPVSQIHDEVETCLDFLRVEAANLPPRHRSIRAVFDNSWKRLTHDEQRVAAKLSVFQGSFTAVAARQVVGASPQTLKMLLNKAIIRRVDNDRFDMHDLLRQYAGEYLSGDSTLYTETHRAHAEYYLTLAGTQATQLRRTLDIAYARPIEIEWQNIQQAWRRAVDIKACDLLEKAVNISIYCEILNEWYEGSQLLQLAYDRLSNTCTRLGSKLLVGLLMYAYHQSDIESLPTLAAECIEMLEQHGLNDETAIPLIIMGSVLMAINEQEQSRRILNHARQQMQQRPELYAYDWGFASNTLAVALQQDGEIKQAIDILEKLIIEFPQVWGTDMHNMQLGSILLRLGKADEAKAAFQRGYTLAQQLGSIQGILSNKLYQYWLEVGDDGNQYDLAEIIDGIAEKFGNWRMLSQLLMHFAIRHHGSEGYEYSDHAFVQAVLLTERHGEDAGVYHQIAHIGQFKATQGQLQQAVDLLSLVENAPRAHAEDRLIAQALIDALCIKVPQLESNVDIQNVKSVGKTIIQILCPVESVA